MGKGEGEGKENGDRPPTIFSLKVALLCHVCNATCTVHSTRQTVKTFAVSLWCKLRIETLRHLH